nr:NADH dehydrogenase subunit 4, mitochondrial [Tanacetum cinerariifolium]
MKEAKIRVKICRGEELTYERKTKSQGNLRLPEMTLCRGNIRTFRLGHRGSGGLKSEENTVQRLMTLNDLRTLGGQACLCLGCFVVAWGIMVRRDRRAPHTAMPTVAFESIFRKSANTLVPETTVLYGKRTAYIRTHTYKPMDTGTYSISIGLLKSDLFRGTRAERRVTIFTSSFGLINQTPIDWEMLKVGWSGMRSYGKEYITASLIREFLMIAVFRMLDPLLFYVLPESVL